jgi:7-cyano-7-deazaguanine synthase
VKAIVLLSGGLDSTTVLAIAKSEGYVPYAMSFNYKQRNQFELESAKRVASDMGVSEHRIVDIDLRVFGGSSLTSDEPVEKNRSFEEIGHGIPATYVPVRNTLFLTYALAWAEILGIADIFIGVNALDSSGYPDCRPEYIDAYEEMANLATKIGTEGQQITIHTPLINLSKNEIIKKGLSLGVDYSLTNTCYDPNPQGIACGTCDSCLLRKRGFEQLGLVDPVRYFS